MTHSALHYGNLVTYMRMKKIVPPSSELGFGRPSRNELKDSLPTA
jgi:hypothetical protein